MNRSLFVISTVMLVCSVPGMAQQATIQGEVHDPSGAAIPEAEVKTPNVNSQAVATAHTNEAGFCLIPALVPG